MSREQQRMTVSEYLTTENTPHPLDRQPTPAKREDEGKNKHLKMKYRKKMKYKKSWQCHKLSKMQRREA